VNRRTAELVLDVVCATAVFLLGILGGLGTGTRITQKEAVRLGHAEWVVDVSGSTTFKWKEVKP